MQTQQMAGCGLGEIHEGGTPDGLIARTWMQHAAMYRVPALLFDPTVCGLVKILHISTYQEGAFCALFRLWKLAEFPIRC